MYQELCHEAKLFKLVFLASNPNQTCEIGDSNDSGLSERRDHEGDILRKRQSSRVKKRTVNYADDEAISR